MPKFKVLGSVAHNTGHSFTSLMNFSGDDYSMGHILRFAREAGVNSLTIDLLTGRGSPATLLREPISGLPARYSKMFLNMVQSSGSDRELLRSATLTLVYDLHRSIPGPIASEPQSPYICDVSIVDVRGKNYAARFEGWWYVERMTSGMAELGAKALKGSGRNRLNIWRRGLAVCGYAALCLAILLHIAMWARAEQIHGFWGHFNEAFRWFQAIDLTSLLAIILCLFGVGWRRWVGSILGLLSFLLCCGYAAGL